MESVKKYCHIPRKASRLGQFSLSPSKDCYAARLLTNVVGHSCGKIEEMPGFST